MHSGARLRAAQLLALGLRLARREGSTLARIAARTPLGALATVTLGFTGAVATPCGGRGLLDHVIEDGRLEIDARFQSEGLAQLILQNAGLDFFDAALGQFAELEGAEGEADEAVDLKPDILQHPLDFAVLAFAQAQGQPAVGALRAVERGVDARIVDSIHGDAFAQRIELALIGVAMGAHAVAPQPAGGGQLQQARQPAVIGEQQQTLGVDVEAPHGDDARQSLGQHIENRRAALGVADRGHEAARLVEQPEPRALAMGHGRAIDHDLVLGADIQGGAVDDDAIHRDAPRRDPFLGVAARAQAHARHDLGDPLLALGALHRAHIGGVGFVLAEIGLAALRSLLALAERLAVARRFALCEGFALPIGFLVAEGLAIPKRFALAIRLARARLALFFGRQAIAHDPALALVPDGAAALLRDGAPCAGSLFFVAVAVEAARGRTWLVAPVLAKGAAGGTPWWASGCATARFPGAALVVIAFVVHAS